MAWFSYAGGKEVTDYRLQITGGSCGIMTTAGQELPYPCSPQAKTLASLIGGGRNVAG